MSYQNTSIKLLLTLSIVTLTSFTSLSQTTCPTFVQTALDFANTACINIGRNEVCYGNDSVTIEAIDEVDFTQSGDTVGVASVESIRLSEMSLTDETWGVSLMRIQADLPETSPGQNVQFVLFGDVNIANGGVAPKDLTAVATGGVNVRLRPTTNENNVIDVLSQGDEVKAIGRLDDRSWIQIELESDNEPTVGWVSADFLRSDEDLNILNIIESSEPTYGVMQAFFLTTGIGDANCNEAPESGILIQTPNGVGEVNLLINEVVIRLKSTAFIQSQPDAELIFNLLEGDATVSALDTTVTVPAGTRVRVGMDATNRANTVPSDPEPYDNTRLVSLPLSLLLDDITLIDALTVEAIEELLANRRPESGLWSMVWTGLNPDDRFPFFCVEGFESEWSEEIELNYADNGDVTLVWAGPPEIGDVNDFTFTPATDTTYTTDTLTLTTFSAESFEIQVLPTEDCRFTVDFAKGDGGA
jgi:hypothetical protein